MQHYAQHILMVAGRMHRADAKTTAQKARVTRMIQTTHIWSLSIAGPQPLSVATMHTHTLD
jgi:hypothetical protein